MQAQLLGCTETTRSPAFSPSVKRAILVFVRPAGLVSTIIPVFNRAEMLRASVSSVIEQTYRPIEIVLVDDGSTDSTPAVVLELEATYAEVIATRIPNSGPGTAREAGRRLARGEFIQHLDSDDVLYPDKFQLQVTSLHAHPDCGAAYGWTRLRLEDGTTLPNPWKRSGDSIATMFPAMLASRWWDTPTPLYRATLLERAGAWTTLRLEEDWEYDARIAALGVNLAFVPAWVCEVRRHGAHSAAFLTEPSRFRERATAHMMILAHARRAGISDDSPEMQFFARELFLLARQCGAAGLGQESRMLFDAARSASGDRGNNLDFRAYSAAATVIGWSGAGRLAALIDRVRR